MNISEQFSPADLSWGLNSLRFSYFNKSVENLAGESLFEDFFGFSADAVTHRKAEFLSEFTTQKGQIHYKATIAGPKVDFITNIGMPEENLDGIPTLPEESDFETSFKKSAHSITEKYGDKIKRIATGFHYVIPVSDHNEGYKVLGKLLPDLDLSGDCHDFQFRINRPREFNTYKINRLSTWSCVVLRIGVVSDGKKHEQDVGHAVLLQTDINTSPQEDFSNLNTKEQLQIIDKLFEYSKEISEKGITK